MNYREPYDYDEHLSTDEGYLHISGKLGIAKFRLVEKKHILQDVKSLKSSPHVIYLLFDANKKTLYVGKTRDVYRRFTTHRSDKKKTFSYAMFITSSTISSSDTLEQFEYNIITHVKDLFQNHVNWNMWKLDNVQTPKIFGTFSVAERGCFINIAYLLNKIPHLLECFELQPPKKSQNIVHTSSKKPICPYCNTTQTQKPIKKWSMGSNSVSHFQCSCGKTFNHFISPQGNEWTMPKSSR